MHETYYVAIPYLMAFELPAMLYQCSRRQGQTYVPHHQDQKKRHRSLLRALAHGTPGTT